MWGRGVRGCRVGGGCEEVGGRGERGGSGGSGGWGDEGAGLGLNAEEAGGRASGFELVEAEGGDVGEAGEGGVALNGDADLGADGVELAQGDELGLGERRFQQRDERGEREIELVGDLGHRPLRLEHCADETCDWVAGALRCHAASLRPGGGRGKEILVMRQEVAREGDAGGEIVGARWVEREH